MMAALPAFTVKRVSWRDAQASLVAIRCRVFIEEQHVPANLEWDGLDGDCVHVLATAAGGAAVGTGRLLPDGRIGRMAVLAQWRGRGIGSAILQELVRAAREAGHPRARLHAQTRALGFYMRLGFIPEGPEFDEAGILHRAMVLTLG